MASWHAGMVPLMVITMVPIWLLYGTYMVRFIATFMVTILIDRDLSHVAL